MKTTQKHKHIANTCIVLISLLAALMFWTRSLWLIIPLVPIVLLQQKFTGKNKEEQTQIEELSNKSFLFFFIWLIALSLPQIRCSALSRIEQVLISINPASPISLVKLYPDFERIEITTSLSATFIWQPYVSIYTFLIILSILPIPILKRYKGTSAQRHIVTMVFLFLVNEPLRR